MASKPTKKRKINAENRVFNPEWTQRYFFIERQGKCVCLICNETVGVFKEFNVKRHFNTSHADNYAEMPADKRTSEIAKRTANYERQTTMFIKIS